MKASSIATVASIALGGTSFAARGFLKSCSDFALTNLNGDKGRSMMLQANCKVNEKKKNWSQLDLNTCFGWSSDSCGFTYPPAGHFTDTVSTCDNHYSGGEEHFGANFGCRGPCTGSGETYNVFALVSPTFLPFSFSSLGYQPLTYTPTDAYIGNSNGKLVC